MRLVRISELRKKWILITVDERVPLRLLSITVNKIVRFGEFDSEYRKKWILTWLRVQDNGIWKLSTKEYKNSS